MQAICGTISKCRHPRAFSSYSIGIYPDLFYSHSARKETNAIKAALPHIWYTTPLLHRPTPIISSQWDSIIYPTSLHA